GRLDHRVHHAGRGDEDARRGGARGGDRVADVGEHGDAVDVGAGLLGAGPGHDLGAVVAVEHAVEAALRAGEALVDDLRGLVDEDAHLATPPASSTAVRAASSMVGCICSRSDRWGSRILRPSSALVPSSRITLGSSICTRPSACTMPFATSSPLVMPPKMFMKMERT